MQILKDGYNLSLLDPIDKSAQKKLVEDIRAVLYKPEFYYDKKFGPVLLDLYCSFYITTNKKLAKYINAIVHKHSNYGSFRREIKFGELFDNRSMNKIFKYFSDSLDEFEETENYEKARGRYLTEL